MGKKLIAIGNILMGDDAIGLRIAQAIKREMDKRKIELILGETDIEYCILNIKNDDYVIFIDSCITGKRLGDLSIYPIDSYLEFCKKGFQHDIDILKLVSLYKLDIKGYIIGIEIEKISFKYGLSKELEGKIEEITSNTILLIDELIH